LEEASQEAIEAAAWYEYEQLGLGAEFLLRLMQLSMLLKKTSSLYHFSPKKPAIPVQNA